MNLRSFLSSRGLSEAAFGQTIAVSQAAVNRYVRGERIPAPRVMAKIVEATDGQVTANDFYGQTDEAA
jgi:DNA-binding transcriptional regulator YdaS (Cro superfamily)